MSLHVFEKKWYDKTTAALRANWVKNFRSAKSFDKFVAGIARTTGLSPATIRSSLPAKNFKAAQSNASQYLQVMLRNLASAYKAKSWSQGYKAAFGGGSGVVPRIRPRKRKSSGTKKTTATKPKKKKTTKKRTTKKTTTTKPKKKKATKKKSTSKSSNRKTYGTKSEAKSARTKGRSVYKVKGGYRLSKKKK